LGDVAMTVPIIHAVATAYPDVRITMVSKPLARAFFEDLAPNVCFMAADARYELEGLRSLNRLFRRMVAKQPTHIADLHDVIRTKFLRARFVMGGYPTAHIDKHRDLRKQFLAGDRQLRLPTSFENYADVFARLGFPIGQPQFVSLFPEGEGGNLNMLPKAVGPKLSWEEWIGLAPFAAHDGKTYPEHLTDEVIRLLLQRYPKARFFLFGRGEREERIFSRWVAQEPRCLFVAKHLENMYQELILISHLDVMLSMDSANMHLASLTDTPVVSIWGATHPRAGFLGWRQSEQNAVQAPLECRPCSIFGSKPCKYGDYRCLTAIAPQAIVDQLSRVIDKN